MVTKTQEGMFDEPQDTTETPINVPFEPKQARSRFFRLLGPDWLVLLAICFSLGAHWLTYFLIGYYQDAAATASQAESVVRVVESNPLMSWAFTLTNLNKIFSIVIVPSYILSVYGLWRFFLLRKYGEAALSALWFFAMITLFVFFMDFSHNAAYTLGILAQNGWFTG